MENWEDNYMEELSKVACQNGGTILELGFGLGLSASKIQEQRIDKHVIIEANYNVFNKLLKFSETAEHTVVPIQGYWEDCIHHLAPDSFDGILFDTYPLTKEQIHKNHFPFFIYAYQLLKKGGIFTYYSDEKSSFSIEHIVILKKAGFLDIDYKVCKLNRPNSCDYWDSDTMIVPIIKK